MPQPRTPSATDRIDKEISIKAPRSRVWRAITDHREFGEWFRCVLDAPFTQGGVARGRITYPGYEHLTMELLDLTLKPEHYFSFRWHPYAVDPDADYSSEPTTLCEFRLEETPGGTLLRVSESGFDAIPAHRRDEAFRMNSGGWAEQVRNIHDYATKQT